MYSASENQQLLRALLEIFLCQGTILVADKEYDAVEMQVFDHFVATETTPLPRYGWAVLPMPSNNMGLLLEKLRLHGIVHTQLEHATHVGKAF